MTDLAPFRQGVRIDAHAVLACLLWGSFSLVLIRQGGGADFLIVARDVADV